MDSKISKELVIKFLRESKKPYTHLIFSLKNFEKFIDEYISTDNEKEKKHILFYYLLDDIKNYKNIWLIYFKRNEIKEYLISIEEYEWIIKLQNYIDSIEKLKEETFPDINIKEFLDKILKEEIKINF
jgi:hypothetical protein